ncbi:hypothetical protein EXS62_02345 [Candidatus Kaiserbacteria bacterium]|nr:hypothetical protein [Candidatus Kaiserbacteria bacterium]
MRDIKHGDGGERSIRNIPVRERRPGRFAYIPEDGPVHLPRRKRHLGRFWFWAFVVIVVAVLGGVLASTVFAGASVTVHPRTELVTMPDTLQAQANAPVGVLPYKIVTVTRSASASVPAQGVQKVSRPASGVLTVTNSYSAASQRLISNTRFEAPDGHIYRIRDSVTVPGMQGTTPGTVTATIYADSPGPAYNKSAGTVFTIPGFKGDPRYTKFSAKSEGAIAGGFIGDEPAVAPADLAAAKATLQKQLEGDVRAAAAQEIPEGYAAISGSLSISFGDLTQTAGDNKTAQLTQTATASGVIVRVADLAGAIAHKVVAGYKGEPVLFAEAGEMNIAVASSSKRSDGGPLTLNLSGTATLVWQFDPGAIQTALAGKNKSEFEGIMVPFHPAVPKAEASIKPFWHGKFPDDASTISIKVAGQ